MSPIPLSRVLAAVFLLSVSFGLAAQEASQAAETPDAGSALQILPAAEVDLGEYLWVNRVLVVFADTPADPRFVKQLQMIEDRPRDLLERDVIVVTDTDPKAGSAARKELRPRGFALVMVDKDGVVKLRKPSPWSTREIARSIDKTPLRRQEILERSGSLGQ